MGASALALDTPYVSAIPLMPPPLLAWVDAAGCVLLVPGGRLTVGGPPRGGVRAGLPLTAPLRAVHAELRRAGEGWVVESIGGPLADDPGETAAPAGRFALGTDGAVRCELSTPNALSPAAVVTVSSGHRPAPGFGAARIEAAVIAAGPVVFGPGDDAHVRVRDARGKLLLRCGPGGWSVRTVGAPADAAGRSGGHAGGSAALDWRPVAAGDAVAGGGVSLRLTAVPDTPT